MGGVRGRSGHIGRMGIDPQSPMCINKGQYRAEKAEGKGKDHYFQNQDEMLNFIRDKTMSYTPMVWNDERQMYKIDFDSVDLLEKKEQDHED